MSEISNFAVVLALPIAAGILLAELLKTIGSRAKLEHKKHRWDFSMRREELLIDNYYKEFDSLMSRNFPLRCDNSKSLLQEQHLHLEAVKRSIESSDLIALVVEEKHKPLLDDAQSKLTRIRDVLKSNPQDMNILKTIKQTDSILRNITMSAHSTLVDVEKTVSSKFLTDTFESMGYRLKTKGSTLVGNSGDINVRADILPNGSIVLDTTSFSGLSCQKEIARFEDKFKEKGVVLRRVLDAQSRRKEFVLLKDPFPHLDTTFNLRTKLKRTTPQPGQMVGEQGRKKIIINQSLHKQKQLLKDISG
jgi:hypothetical protein